LPLPHGLHGFFRSLPDPLWYEPIHDCSAEHSKRRNRLIKEHCFTEEWLDAFKKQKEHKRIDKAILERMI